MRKALNISITPMHLAVFAVLLATIAYAAGTIAIDYSERWVKAGITIGSTYSTSAPVARITASGSCVIVNDFAAIDGQHGCSDSYRSGTCTGVGFGDTVELGVDQTIASDVQLTPQVTASNAVKVRACADGITDGGSVDLPDASYTIRWFSSR